MQESGPERYEWNPLRKVWHFTGCLIIIGVFWFWKDRQSPVHGSSFLLVFGWLLAVLAVGIDVVRLRSPRQNSHFQELPLVKHIMRPEEQHQFNASTYIVVAAALLVTVFWMGYCTGATVIRAIAVLGIADPAAAWMRHGFRRFGHGWVKALGLAVFTGVGFLVLWLACQREQYMSVHTALLISMLTGVSENYAGGWYAWIRRMTTRGNATRFLQAKRRWYPDDNLFIPLMVAALTELLPRFF